MVGPRHSSKRRAAASVVADPPTKRAKVSTISDAKTKANTSVRRTTAHPGKASTNSPPKKILHVYVFGEGSAGELGLGNRNALDVSIPRLNPNLAGAVSLAAGGMHGVALGVNNEIITWGVNDHGALGRDTAWDGGLRDVAQEEDSGSDSDGDLNPRESTPTSILPNSLPKGTRTVQLAAGDSATFILTSDGHVYGWGTFRDSNGVFGFLHDPTTNKTTKIQTTPILVPNLKNIKCISAGADFALALDFEGRVFAWGSGQQQQLGRRIIERRRHLSLTPQRVELPKNRKMVSVHAGIDHAFAIDSEGDTWAWGLNNFAQTGIPAKAGEEDASIPGPQKVAALIGKKMRMISGGRHHSIGISQAGECLVWGRMDGGQLGLDMTSLPLDDASKVLIDERGKPRVLLQPTSLPIPACVHATAGPDHCIAITSDGKAYSWGFNVNYQCGQGTSDDIFIAKSIEKKSISDIKFCWAGAGGQYSMLASYQLSEK